jgi:cytochrome P450
MFGTTMAAVGTVDHDIHRRRRAALNPFFSARSVTRLEPIIQSQVDKLHAKLIHFRNSGEAVNLSDAFACLSADVISDCAFGKSYGLLELPSFAPWWRRFMMELSLGTHLMKQFGWVYQSAMATAPWLLTLMHPLSKKLDQLRRSKYSMMLTAL